MTNQNQPYGCDISKYQFSDDGKRKINFDKLNPLIKFCGVRAGISWGYTDPWYSYSKAHLIAPRLDYHVTYPGEDANRQMDHFLRITNPQEHDRLVLDLELDHGFSRYRITQTVIACLERLRKETGRYPIIYSRAGWVNQFLQVNDLPKGIDWWIANYLKALPAPFYTKEHPGPPLLPRGVTNWLIHQTGEKGNGGAHGVASYYVDQNRWNGTEAELLAYFGTTGGVPEPEFPKPDPVLFKAKVTATLGLRVREGAGLGYPVSANSLPYGTIVEVYEINNGWCFHNRGGWSDGSWLVPLADNPVPPVVVNEPYYGALYWQRDPRWKDVKLGTSGTIGAYGCAMCAETNALNQLGINTNPMINNTWRTNNGGYKNGNLINWEKVSEQHPEIAWEGRTYNPTDAQMLAKINSGSVLVILVDHNESTAVLDEHWVNSVNRGDNQLWVFDPWDNQLVRLRDRYKKAIQQFTSYRRA